MQRMYYLGSRTHACTSNPPSLIYIFEEATGWSTETTLFMARETQKYVSLAAIFQPQFLLFLLCGYDITSISVERIHVVRRTYIMKMFRVEWCCIPRTFRVVVRNKEQIEYFKMEELYVWNNFIEKLSR